MCNFGLLCNKIPTFFWRKIHFQQITKNNNKRSWNFNFLTFRQITSLSPEKKSYQFFSPFNEKKICSNLYKGTNVERKNVKCIKIYPPTQKSQFCFEKQKWTTSSHAKSKEGTSAVLMRTSHKFPIFSCIVELKKRSYFCYLKMSFVLCSI